MKPELYATRRPFTPAKDQIYATPGGTRFECILEPSKESKAWMRNCESGWTFLATGLGMYADGAIDWNFSLYGRFT